MKHWIKDTPGRDMLKSSDNFIGKSKSNLGKTRYHNLDNIAFLGIDRCQNCQQSMLNKRDPRHRFCNIQCMEEYKANH
jgi:hypothetical protein